MIEVRLLGAVTASRDGYPVDLGSVQRRGVLARLAVAGGAVVGTDRLIDDLWSGEPPPRALAGLQAHVSHLRRVLEPDRPPRAPATVLVSAAGGYALRLDGGAVDASHAVARRERARTEPPGAAVDTLRAALALFTGVPLAEFGDAAWARPEIERLTELRRGLVEELAAAELTRGHAAGPGAVVDLLTPLVRDEPLREEPARLLALALYRSGRQADALAALAALRRHLAGDLGLDPSPALAALERRILVHDPDLLAVTPAPPPGTAPGHVSDAPLLSSGDSSGASLTSPSLVGREPELARLRALADAAVGRPGQLALVAGEAGAGKSALADALLDRLAAAGWRTVRGRCPEAGGAPPGWAWTEVLDALGGPAPGTPRPDDPHHAFHVGRVLLATVAAVTVPLLVVLDDLHRADEETLRLLRTVASARVPGTVVVGTFRPDEVGEDLLATVAALATVTAERVELPGLDPAAVAAVIGREGLDVTDDDAARIAARTGGNPLFVREVARLARTVGLATAATTVPAGVRDVLRRRAAQLPAASASVLRRAAVLGRDVDVGVLLALEDDDEDRVLAACEAGVVTGLLVESGSDAVRFAHDLVRETLYDELPRLRRARVHAEALTVLEGRRPDDHAGLARHALAAGSVAGLPRVLDHAERAADDARRDGAPRTAADLVAGALALTGPGTPDVDPRRRLALRCRLAAAWSHAGAGRPAVEERTAALVDAARLVGDGPLDDDDRAALLDAATCVDGPVTFALAENAALDRPLLDTVARLLDDPGVTDDDRARLHAARAFARHPREPAAALADSEAARGLVGTSDDPLLRCVVLNARFWTMLQPDRWAGLDAVGTELLDAAERAGSWGHRTVGHHARFLHACYREAFDDAAGHARRALTEAPDGQLAAALGWTAVFRALSAQLEERYDEAERDYREIGAALAQRGLANASGLALVGLVGVYDAQGRLAELVEPLAAEHRRRGDIVAEGYAAALVAAGRYDDARRVWRPDVPVPPDWWWLLFTVLRARTALALADAAVARACLDALTPWAGHLAGAMSGTATLGRVDEGLVAALRAAAGSSS